MTLGVISIELLREEVGRRVLRAGLLTQRVGLRPAVQAAGGGELRAGVQHAAGDTDRYDLRSMGTRVTGGSTL